MVLKNKRSELEEKFYTLCQKVVVEAGLALYDIEYNGSSRLLRLFIYQPQTETADLLDCVRIDEALTPCFEEESWIPEGICLEVSSPGVFRSLRQIEHFQRAQGEWIKLRFGAPLKRDKELLFRGQTVIRALLLKTQEDGIFFRWDDQEYFIPFEEIKKANLDPDLESIADH